MKKIGLLVVLGLIVSFGMFGQENLGMSGNVGVGTSSPTMKLDVNGTLSVGSHTENNSIMTRFVGHPLDPANYSLDLVKDSFVLGGVKRFNWKFVQRQPGLHPDYKGTVDGVRDVLTFSYDGKVGIFDPNPAYDFTVNGTFFARGITNAGPLLIDDGVATSTMARFVGNSQIGNSGLDIVKINLGDSVNYKWKFVLNQPGLGADGRGPAGTRDVFTINNLGQVGIFDENPAYDLSVNGTFSAKGITNVGDVTSTGSFTNVGNFITAGQLIVDGGSPLGTVYMATFQGIGAESGLDLIKDRLANNQFQWRLQLRNPGVGADGRGPTNHRDVFFIDETGQVGLCTEPEPGIALAVNGVIAARGFEVQNIVAESITIKTDNYADFVFEDDYDLPTLDAVEAFIDENGHLPEIPSEAEAMENGLNIADMNVKLLQKVEELTLYLIEQNKQLAEQNERIAELEAKLGE